MSDEMVGTVKLGADGWPIRYCKDRHGNFGWVGMILPPWDRNGTYDFVSGDNRATIFPSSEAALTEVIHNAMDTALAQITTWFAKGGVAPRRIETRNELDALPETVVIMDDNGGVARKYGGEWRWVGMEVSFQPSLPVTVLWSPEAAS